MYNSKDIQFVGKHDYDEESAARFASYGTETFSINIFKWELKSNGKEMKRGKCVVRVKGKSSEKQKVISHAEFIVLELDNNDWDGRKTVSVNW